MLFEPFQLKNIKLKNRTVLPPMCMYSSDAHGFVHDFHVIHYATRAIGGVGLIIQEATAVDPDGRITTNDLGIWSDEHIEGLKDIVDTVHQYGVPIGIQINHAGRKAKIDNPIGPSAIAFGDYKVPLEMDADMIHQVVYQFREAARRSNAAGYDLLEIHAAHGYLLFEFLSPLSNKRSDVYKNGVLLLKKVITAINEVWPKEKVLAIRVSAFEFIEGGVTPQMISDVINEIKDLGIDLVDVSTGGNILTKYEVFPGYQLKYADFVKKHTGLPVIGGGMIEDLAFADQAIIKNQCDLVYLGRLLLREPYHVINHAKDLEADIEYPIQYIRAKK